MDKIIPSVNYLSAEFLQKLVTRLDDANTLGIVLVGSFARAAGSCYSDVDLWHFVRQMPAGDFQAYRLELIDDRIVSIKTLLLEKEQQDFKTPERAIWAVPGWAECKILLDRDGQLNALRESARQFDRASLQAAADRYASCHLAGSAEEVCKLLDGLASNDEGKTLYAIWSMGQDLAHILLVQRMVLVPTENLFIRLAQETAGTGSEWTRQFRLAVGLDPIPEVEPPFEAYGKGGLALYRETVHLLDKVIQQDDRPVVEKALAMMKEAGYP